MSLLTKRLLKYSISFAVLAIAIIYLNHSIRQFTSLEKFESFLSTFSLINHKQEIKGDFLITYVIDGDTIIINNKEKVRLIGVDAPEIDHMDSKGEWYGEEAKEFLKQLIERKKCTLEYDNNLRDIYGRILAYVFISNRLINAELIKQGYAQVYYRFNFKRKAEFAKLEREAKTKKLGLWKKQSSEKTEQKKSFQNISWQDADKHYGEYCTVEGKVVSSYNSGKACFLNFNKDYNHSLAVVIFSSDFDKFPPHPENYYFGKKILVSGYIKEYKRKPEIVLEEQRSIEVLK